MSEKYQPDVKTSPQHKRGRIEAVIVNDDVRDKNETGKKLWNDNDLGKLR
jgi:hypothetical protein